MGAGTDCAICFEPVGDKDIVSLPCRHMLHLQCSAGWLEEHGTCPTCRQKPPVHWRDYSTPAEQKVLVRLREWVISGMCERCQAVFHERDPLISLPQPDGTTLCVPMSRSGLTSVADSPTR